MVKPEGKRPHARHMRRWECNVNIDLKEMIQDMDKWRAVVKTVMDPWVP